MSACSNVSTRHFDPDNDKFQQAAGGAHLQA